MNCSLVLTENNYKEIPEGMTPDDNENGSAVIKTVNLPDSFAAYERPERFYIGFDGEVKLEQTGLLLEVKKNILTVTGDMENERIYWNQKRLTHRQTRIIRGDSLLIGNALLVFYRDHIRIYSDQDIQPALERIQKADIPYPAFPDYKRSPRIIKRVVSAKLDLKSPPNRTNAKKGSLLATILPPIATAAMTIVVGLMMGRGKYLLMSAGATAMTTIMSVVRFFSDRREINETNHKLTALYEEYLLKKRKELYQTYQKEQEAYRYNYPGIEELARIVHSFDSRIYERLSTDQDFLTCSIGRQYLPVSFDISLNDSDLTNKEEELYQQAAGLKKEYQMMWKELAVDLKKAHLGVVGDKKTVHEQLKLYLCQLATFQSYRDLQMIVLYDEAYAADFEWMKWLPHCKIQALNVRGLIHTEKARDQILNSMNQILKDRSQKLEESKKESRFAPHFLFVIDEPKLIMDHSIMEHLDKPADTLGFSIIYTSYLRANLPEHVTTVLQLNHAQEGTLVLKEKEYCNETVVLHQKGSVNLELFARNLGVLNHLIGTTSHIPESITFFEMYQVLSPEELDIRKRWAGHCAEKSLAVPLGVRAQDDIVELNLHEKAHGPHGLVAGTTGSGKSEIIQSYILSLGVNFHPHEVGFLLIDYKGGGMAGLFKNLPHLLGTITNLDGSESMRALASIKSELARRQKIFGEHSVNHINGYMTLFREGAVSEPIPHLFLISDEFAELKKEQPEFMKELVSTARIGRSLGVHLILATQKPTGVVDDQIWTNSKFKLALKVQDESDSKEILKTPDAASITQAGRAYLQVGNNEIYELFQSAWSGASYIKGQEKEVTLDNRVYLVNDLGQRVLVNQDLGGTKEEKTAKETQLDVTIDHIKAVYEQEHAVPVKRPWLPALKPVVLSSCAGEVLPKQKENRDFTVSVPIGMIDIPEEQKQEDYVLDFTKDGNLMYIASSGYGKSVLLTTVALGLSVRYPVHAVNLFILDFGNNALIALKKLPHTAEYITLDDTETYDKFKNLLTKEMKTRKKLMAEQSAQNFQVYNQTVETPMCAWVILVDNFDAIKEMGFDQEEYFTKASRDGVSLGIYFAITATRNNAIRGATFNNFKNKVAGFNFEKGEVMALVGRSPYTLPEIRGRSLVKYGERISIMQIYTMVLFANDLEYREGINRQIEAIRAANPGEEAPHMPQMPEDLDMEAMKRFKNPEVEAALGLETERVTTEGIDRTNSPFTIMGNAGSGKTNLLRVMLNQLIGTGTIQIFDSPARDLKGYEGEAGVSLVKDMDQFVKFMDELEKEVIRREQMIEQDPNNQDEVIGTLKNYVVIIDSLTDFYSRKTTSEAEIADMLRRAADVSILIIATNLLSKFYGSDPVSEFFKRSPNGMLLSPQGHMEVAPVSLKPGTHEGAFYKRGRSVLVRIPKA